MTQKHKKLPFLIFFILLGKHRWFGGTPINYTWIDNSAMTLFYLDSPDA